MANQRPSKCLLSISPAAPSHTEVWRKDSVEPYLPFVVFLSKYLDKVIKTDQCAHDVDDAQQLINNLRATF